MKNESVFNSEKELKNFVKNNSSLLFGDNIEWLDPNMTGEYGRKIRPDLLGRYKSGDELFLIVEVKLVSKAIERSDRNPYDPMRLSIGQCLHYFHASRQLIGSFEFDEQSFKNLSRFINLFIVTDVCAEPIENMCRVLRAHGIEIKCIDASSYLDD